MAAVNLNTVRKVIEKRLVNELNSAPPIPVVFNNMPFDPTAKNSFVQCQINFGANEYITQETGTQNSITGLITLNVFTKDGLGSGANFVIGKRLRDLYNRITVSGIIFDAVVGPEVLAQPPEGKFVTQLRITFETFETL